MCTLAIPTFDAVTDRARSYSDTYDRPFTVASLELWGDGVGAPLDRFVEWNGALWVGRQVSTTPEERAEVLRAFEAWLTFCDAAKAAYQVALKEEDAAVRLDDATADGQRRSVLRTRASDLNAVWIGALGWYRWWVEVIYAAAGRPVWTWNSCEPVYMDLPTAKKLLA